MTGMTWWTGKLPVAEASFLAGRHSPLNGSGSTGIITCDNEGELRLDEPARACLSLLPPDRDGACRRAADGAVEIQAGGAWYRLEPAHDHPPSSAPGRPGA